MARVAVPGAGVDDPSLKGYDAPLLARRPPPTFHFHMDTQELEAFKELLEEHTAGRSELAKGAYKAGQRVAHLPD